MKTSDSPTLPLPPVSVSRRRFLTAAATGAAGLVILPSGVLSGQDAPSNKLNVALIGTWGRGEAHFDALAKENVVALCDVYEPYLLPRLTSEPNYIFFGGKTRRFLSPPPSQYGSSQHRYRSKLLD